jgi:ElaB/YqjD/DUF883 family membrane-anchored ribosome-binding protein
MADQTGVHGTDQEERSVAGQVAESAQQTAQQAVQQVQDRALEAKGQVGSRVRQLVDERSGDAASQVQSTAEAMRRTGSQLREEGSDAPARIAEAVADRTERLGAYLEQADADRLLRDVENYARRQPWLVAAGGFVLGVFASRIFKASSANRYQSGAAFDGSSTGVYVAGGRSSVGEMQSASGGGRSGAAGN